MSRIIFVHRGYEHMVNKITSPIQGNFKVDDIVKGERYIVFDESGNMGVSGNYFLISFIDTKDAKSLHNIMKRKIYQFPTYVQI